jgi:cobalt-zinc-cadmium efflux system membrane fusion protein
MNKNRVRGVVAGSAIAILAIIGWSLSGGGQDEQAKPEARPAAPAADGLLAVAPDKAAKLGIRTAPAVAAGEAPVAELPATMAPPPNARVAVAATLPGVVLRTMVVEGDMVRQGQALAVVQSRDMLTLGADLARADARLGYARSYASRLDQLSREGVIAGARADEARAAAAEASADVGEKARILRMVGGKSGQGSYTLTAPIAGRVTHADIQAGNPLDGSSAPFVIDAVGRYEVTAQLPQALVGTVRPGMKIQWGEATGTVTSVGTTIDPSTRSATLRATLPGGEGLIAGRSGTVTLFGSAPAGAVSVPSDAVVDIDGATIVFVPIKGGYVRRAVTAGAAVGDHVLILDGIKPGEPVVAAGTSALKALLLAQQ